MILGLYDFYFRPLVEPQAVRLLPNRKCKTNDTNAKSSKR